MGKRSSIRPMPENQELRLVNESSLKLLVEDALKGISLKRIFFPLAGPSRRVMYEQK